MKLLLNNTFIALAFIVLVTSAVFIPLIGNCPLFDWDEINFAECAREMVVTGNYSNVQLNYNPFWEKPPFFIWLQAISMNIFGVNEFAARFPNVICGILTFCTLFLVGKKTYSSSFGLTWVLIYAGTLLPHFYFKSGIIDPWFNYFIFLSFYQVIIHINNPVGKEGLSSAILSGFFLGLAVLTKGPAAVLIMGVFVGAYWAMQRFRKISSLKFVLVFVLSLVISGCSWFIIELLRGNYEVIKAFFDYQVRLFKTEDSDHGGPFFYHIVVLLLGCFPSSLFMLLSFKRSQSDTPYQSLMKRCMTILFFTVLIIFSLVKTKIVHYSSMCYLPLTYLATYSIFKLFSGEYKVKRWFTIPFLVIGLLIGIVFTAIGFVGKLKDLLLSGNLIDDVFAVENLKADVNWQGWEWMIGLSFMITVILVFVEVKKGRYKIVYSLYVFLVVFIVASINTLTPKIELYSQHAAIEFYKAIAKKNFYVETIGFKSYAYLFYSEKMPVQNQNPVAAKYISEQLESLEKQGFSRISSYSLAYANWMQYGVIDKPALFVTKVNGAEGLLSNPDVRKLYSKNGFVFCVRMP